MNKQIWKAIIDFSSISEYPLLPCPYCKEHRLKLDGESIDYKEAPCSY